MARTATSRNAPAAATVLSAAVDAVDEHLYAYGHRLNWEPAGGARSMGTCRRCSGRVIVRVDDAGRPAAMADPHMISPAARSEGHDYAECPSAGR
jgi:hypothetical protein